MQKILIIDDDEDVRSMLKMTLEMEGYNVLTANDGNMGTKLYRENPADLIVTDIIMPEKEGLETIRELHKDFPGVKIIAISGGGEYALSQYLDVAKQFGAVNAFSKPVDLDALLHEIKKHVPSPSSIPDSRL